MSLYNLLESVDNNNLDGCLSELKSFNNESAKAFEFAELKDSSIRVRFWDLVKELLKSPNSDVLNECLHVIRIVSRDKKSLEFEMQDEHIREIFNKAELLTENPFYHSEQINVVIEAQKCLCNMIYNSKLVQQYCSDKIILRNSLKLLESFSDDSLSLEAKYFHCKIIFLITALCPSSRGTIVNEFQGLSIIVSCLGNMVNYLVNDDNLTGQVCCELLKSLFNLLLVSTSDADCTYSKLVEICNILMMKSSSMKISHELRRHTVNLLCNVPCQYYNKLVSQDNGKSPFNYLNNDMSIIHELHNFLAHQLDSLTYEVREGMTEGLCPVLKILTEASHQERCVRKYLKSLILPPLKDVRQRPEEGNTMRNKLCRLLTHPVSEIKDITAEFLFVLCKENVNRMVKYTGYGNAAGMLAQRGLLLGNKTLNSEYSTDSEDSDTEEYRQYVDRINPITGCYEEPQPQELDTMTEEQKEYEAMRLVSMIDRISQSGLIQPATIGEDGKPHPIEHVLQLQNNHGTV